ncbi:hypothetical protein BCR37DRAFT_378779 [Protomyces lactucae-debilis]|uniref:Uncharacterized protein n=1 Tax=Protomyces lactucae-debilis TaxID=2754530 RepID=A0A1Y2FKQ9_PROLT|nr:uncharacterized protein BCR37DRAFT_378779 [Protomyces lactucae-debilis]ORY83796.1 hypothetical protein BCR37DRAFT_378779 [Protomyces lactucae-debilis]
MSSHMHIFVMCLCWMISLAILSTEARFWGKDILECRQYAMARSTPNITLLRQPYFPGKKYWPPGAKFCPIRRTWDECPQRCRYMVEAAALVSAIAGEELLGAEAINLLQARKAYLSDEDSCAANSGACLDYYYESLVDDNSVAVCNCFAVILIMRVHKGGKNCTRGDVIKRLNDRFAPFGFQYNKDANNDDVHCGARGANMCKLSDPVGFKKTDVCDA